MSVVKHPMSLPWLDWQPMKDAPRDGKTWVILYSSQSPEPYNIARWSYNNDSWSTASGEVWVDDELFSPEQWALIPEPRP